MSDPYCRHRKIEGDDAVHSWACVRCGQPFSATPRAALSSGASKPERTTFAWLIEMGQPEGYSPPIWWAECPDPSMGVVSYQDRWTKDAWEAAWFSSRVLADDVIRHHGFRARAVEHGFIGASEPDYCGSCGKRGHYAGDRTHSCTGPDERPEPSEPADAATPPPASATSEGLAEVIGKGVHDLTTSIDHRLAHTGLDEDCRVIGRVIAGRLSSPASGEAVEGLDVAFPDGASLNERRAWLVYEGARLAAAAALAPIIPEPWQRRERAFRAQFLAVIERQTGPDRQASPADLHADWVRAYEAMGWVYGPTRDPVAKTHPDMVPYDDLGQLERDKDAVFVALCEIARQWVYATPAEAPTAGD